MNLMKRLKQFDWYYAYSDDHSVWTRWHSEEAKLRGLLSDYNSPYDIAQLRKAVQDMVIEDFKEESPGKWYRHPRKYQNVAPSSRGDLIHRADQVQILAWIEHKDREIYG